MYRTKSFATSSIAFALATLATSGLFSVAQAAPPLPGWPANSAERGRWSNDPWNERQVMSGEVVKRYSNTEYDLRAGDGHTFRVRSDDAISLNRGDEVRVSGDWTGKTFFARTITLIDRDGGFGNWGDRNDRDDWNSGAFRTRVEVTGIVAQRYGVQTFELRTPIGRTYLVRGDNSTPNLRTGDRVRVLGFVSGNRVRSTQISNLSANGGVVGPGNGNWGNRNDDWDNRFPSQPNRGGFPNNGGFPNSGGFGRDNGDIDAGIGLDVDFPGRIESISLSGREATVRGDNGRTYRVRTTQNELEGYRAGDRIRVRGIVRNDWIEADDLNRIR